MDQCVVTLNKLPGHITQTVSFIVSHTSFWDKFWRSTKQILQIQWKYHRSRHGLVLQHLFFLKPAKYISSWKQTYNQSMSNGKDGEKNLLW